MFNFVNKSKSPTKTLSLSAGFSLIELIVVIGIITLITSVTLINHNRFSGGVALENLAYEIALAIRQAQFFGINVRSAAGSFDAGYGVYFDKNNPTSFILFADIDNDRFYGGAEEMIEVYTMTRGNQIKYLCVDSGCLTPEASSFDKLNITFVRPDPDAIIKTEDPSLCDNGTEIKCGLAKIYVGSPSENVLDKVISIGVTGFISVDTYHAE